MIFKRIEIARHLAKWRKEYAIACKIFTEIEM